MNATAPTVCLVLLLAALPALAAPSPPNQPFLIAGNDTHDQRMPDASRDRVVWADDRDYPSAQHDEHEIYLYDGSTGAVTRLTHVASSKTTPRISGDWVVWADNRRGNQDLYSFDLRTKEERLLTPNDANQTSPAFDYPWVAYQDDRHGRDNLDVWLLNLDTKESKQLTPDVGRQVQPSVGEGRVAWAEITGGSGFSVRSDVYVYDIASGETRKVSDGGLNSAPDAWGDEIVWQAAAHGTMGYDILLHRWSSASSNAVESDPSDQMAPRVRDGLLAWIDYRDVAAANSQGHNAGRTLYLRDLAGDGVPRRITDSAQGSVQAIALTRDVVAWTFFRADGGAGAFDLWGMRLNAGVPPAAGTTSPTTAAASPLAQAPVPSHARTLPVAEYGGLLGLAVALALVRRR